MKKAKRISNNSKKSFVIGFAVVGGLVVAGLIFANFYKFYNPSNAGSRPSCLTNVESLVTSKSCSTTRFKKASYRCVGGYTGTVGDGKTCVTKSYLRSLAATKCKTKATCQMFVTKYSETFNSNSSFDTHWENITKVPQVGKVTQQDGYKFDNANGLKIFVTSLATATDFAEYKIGYKRPLINGDFYAEFKGIKLTTTMGSSKGQIASFAATQYAPNDPIGKTLSSTGFHIDRISGFTGNAGGHPANMLTAECVKGSNSGVGTDSVAQTWVAPSPQTVGITDLSKPMNLRIYRIGNAVRLDYDFGAGYKTLNTCITQNVDWTITAGVNAIPSKSSTVSIKSFEFKTR